MGEVEPNSHSKGPVILAVLYPVTVLASLFVAGRLFSRRRKLGKWAADDYIIMMSIVCDPCLRSPSSIHMFHFGAAEVADRPDPNV